MNKQRMEVCLTFSFFLPPPQFLPCTFTFLAIFLDERLPPQAWKDDWRGESGRQGSNRSVSGASIKLLPKGIKQT